MTMVSEALHGGKKKKVYDRTSFPDEEKTWGFCHERRGLNNGGGYLEV